MGKRRLCGCSRCEILREIRKLQRLMLEFLAEREPAPKTGRWGMPGHERLKKAMIRSEV